MSTTQVSTAANSKEKVDVQIASTQAADLEVPTLVEDAPEKQGKGIRFWLVLASLLLSNFLAVLEGYAVSTALPTIVADLHADQYLWVVNIYGITSSALLPLSGGLSEAFGRRPVIIVSVTLYAIGSAVSGAAHNLNMLIVARAIQGAGAGGIYSLTQIILSDLVTLKERGAYNGSFGLTWVLGGSLGPLIGGALAKHTLWRWLFYLNVPACGLVLVLMTVFLRLNKPPSWSPSEALRRVDPIGNLLIIGSTCAIVIGLIWGGVQYPWVSAPVLTPILVGGVGIIVFLAYEWTICPYPVVPKHLLSNRTSLSGYVQISLSSMVNITLLYFLPIYYQACKDASPIASGVDLLGLCIASGPFGVISGASVTITKRYRPQLWLAWCLILVGLGLMNTITDTTNRMTSIGYQIPVGLGIGTIFASCWFPVLAPLPVTSNASAVALLIYLRTFSQIWSVTIGGALMQNALKRRLPESIAAQAGSGGDAIAYSIVPLIRSLPEPLKSTAQHAFAESLVPVWRLLIGIAGAGFLVSLVMKGLPLHTTKDETWAMEDEKKSREKAEP